MRKLTECLIVLAFLLCAFTAQAASEIDVSVPSAGEPCTSDLSCDPGELCVNDICSAPGHVQMTFNVIPANCVLMMYARKASAKR